LLAGAAGIVDPRGRVVARASTFVEETLTVDLGGHGDEWGEVVPVRTRHAWQDAAAKKRSGNFFR